MRPATRAIVCLCFCLAFWSCLWGNAVAGTPLGGNDRGDRWAAADVDAKLTFCQRAFAAFRGSPSQSYIISHGVQSLSPAGLCDRIDQFYSLEENRDTRLSEAAAIAPLLFADTPLGTLYAPTSPPFE